MLPGYTHLQIAMPSSFGLWFSAYAEILADEVLLLNTVHTCVTKIHSEVLLAMAVPSQLTDMTPQQRSGLTPEIQCRSSTNESGKTEKNLAQAIGSLAGTLSRFSMDVCLYMSQNFDFISFPDDITTGSASCHTKKPRCV